ncbi:MAG: anthranilate phosphoribosyltransferase [Pseudomonadota bacterium]
MDMQTAIRVLLDRQSLDAHEMEEVMDLIMTGGATPAQIGGFLVALRMKGEVTQELLGAARVMRRLAKAVDCSDVPYLVDTCGTGGDGSGLFNVSTAAAFVVAAAGGHVAKHGNRSVSSKSGSADLLEAAGVNLQITAEEAGRCIRELGFGFLFAPMHHEAMKHAIGPRRELGVRTVFNMLGPLTNPAGAKNAVLGVYSKDLLRPIADVCLALDQRHVFVVHAADGLDEISIATETFIAEVKNGAVHEYTITPADLGLERGSLETLRAANAQQSLAVIEVAFRHAKGPAADIIAANAGAAICAAGLCATLKQGVQMAQDAMASGMAREKLEEYVRVTQLMKKQ